VLGLEEQVAQLSAGKEAPLDRWFRMSSVALDRALSSRYCDRMRCSGYRETHRLRNSRVGTAVE
jgi:hypothetical protein